jgi:hypothetical protein
MCNILNYSIYSLSTAANLKISNSSGKKLFVYQPLIKKKDVVSKKHNYFS